MWSCRMGGTTVGDGAVGGVLDVVASDWTCYRCDSRSTPM